MVAPLFMISLLWERFDWRASRMFHPRSFTWLPNWAAALVLLLLLALLSWRALRQVGSNATSEETQAYDGERVDDESMKENISEH
jgi:hypothetical protein